MCAHRKGEGPPRFCARTDTTSNQCHCQEYASVAGDTPAPANLQEGGSNANGVSHRPRLCTASAAAAPSRRLSGASDTTLGTEYAGGPRPAPAPGSGSREEELPPQPVPGPFAPALKRVKPPFPRLRGGNARNFAGSCSLPSSGGAREERRWVTRPKRDHTAPLFQASDLNLVDSREGTTKSGILMGSGRWPSLCPFSPMLE